MAAKLSGSRPCLAWGIALAGLGIGCADPTGRPLIDIPEYRVVTATVARGAPVQLEVTNTTASEVVLESPVCTTRFEQYSRGQWFDAPPVNPDCVGTPVTLAVGAGLRYGIAAPVASAGQYRAVLHGTNADGTFVVRSPSFTVE